MRFYYALCFAYCLITAAHGDANSYRACLDSVRSGGQNGQPPRDEKGQVTFQETALQSKNYCEQLTRNDCLFYHEATEKCSCVCQELITSNKDRMGNPAKQSNPSNVNNPPRYRDPGECFHGDVVVETDRGSMTLAELARTTESVSLLSRNAQTGHLEMSPVVYWTHANPNIETEFVDFETESGHKLSITGQHLIYDTDCQGNKRTVFAKRVEVGRCLYVSDGGDRSIESPVVSKTAVVKKGIYAPITSSGNVMVNGIAASCYTNGENERLYAMIFGCVVKARQLLATFLPNTVLNVVFGDPFSSVVEAPPSFMYSFLDLSKAFLRLK